MKSEEVLQAYRAKLQGDLDNAKSAYEQIGAQINALTGAIQAVDHALSDEQETGADDDD